MYCSFLKGAKNTESTDSLEYGRDSGDKRERWRYPRFFGQSDGERAVIAGDDARHILTVLRMKPGERVVLCDGRGKDYLCRIVLCQKDFVELEAEDSRKNEAEPTVEITLFQCLPKSDKMDFIVQKATELGAARVVPVLSKRCVSRPDEKNAEKKVCRWQKIAEEAAKQSGRGRIPEICSLTDFRSAVREYGNKGKGILFYECGGKKISQLITAGADKIGVFVGSEGGFEPEEAAFAEGNGIEAATLGKRILRCETAPIAALSVLMNLTGNL
ncbi:MAG TPA: 16S rRNA (uracil(1498)-N(3))-methyltransferase [Ruminococcaceae bacterium]|nr:16S rRNA (uracil(1498)-N(3))-methyltransferase [Oscillospiraceae bacterium]